MLQNALAIMLAIRCQQPEATKQLLAFFFQSMEEAKAKSMMLKVIYLLSPKERDWLRDLA